MKSTIPLIALIVFMSCNSGTDRSAKIDSSAVEVPDTTTSFTAIDSSSEFLDTFSSNLKPWLQQTIKNPQVRLSDFKYAENWVDDSLVVKPQNMDKDFLKTYRSVIVYSPDEKKVLDLGSYGTVIKNNASGQPTMEHGEPDIEVAVIDLQHKKRRRILFSGP